MYVESAPGASGFPEHLRKGSWQDHVSDGGPGSEISVNGGMGADAATAPAAPPVRMMVTTPAHSAVNPHMPMIVGIICVLGLGFVIYKATRD